MKKLLEKIVQLNLLFENNEETEYQSPMTSETFVGGKDCTKAIQKDIQTLDQRE